MANQSAGKVESAEPGVKARPDEVQRADSDLNVSKTNIDLTSLADSKIAMLAATARDAPAGTVGMLEITGDKNDDNRIAKSSTSKEAHDKLMEAVEPVLGEGNAKRFEEEMGRFEQRMNTDAERMIAASNDKGIVEQDTESSIRETFEHLRNMVTSNNPKALFSPEERVQIAKDFLHAAVEPTKVSMNHHPFSDAATQIYMYGLSKHPEKIAGELEQMATTGTVKAADGNLVEAQKSDFSTPFVDSHFYRSLRKK